MSTFEAQSAPLQPQKTGCGGRPLLIILGIFGVLGLLCCGGVGYLYYAVMPEITTDPARIAEITETKIADIAIPDQLTPEVAVSANVPFQGQFFMAMTIYGGKGSGNKLVLVVIDRTFLNQENAALQAREMQRKFEEEAGQKGEDGPEEIEAEETYEKKVTINDQEETFTISKGLGKKTQTPRITVVGAFEGEAGQVRLFGNVNAEEISEEQIIEMIESIK